MNGRRSVVIVDGVRTPFCKAWGVLEDVPADDLARQAIAEAVARIDLDPEAVDEVVVGNIAQPADTTTLARVAALRAGMPRRVPAVTVNRNCGSGVEAIATAWHRVESGLADVVVAAGVESMSRIPFQLGQGFYIELPDPDVDSGGFPFSGASKRHTRFPVSASTAWKLPSPEPTKRTPSASCGTGEEFSKSNSPIRGSTPSSKLPSVMVLQSWPESV